MLDALETFRGDQPTGRGCAFLAAAAELPDLDHPARLVVAAESAALDERLHRLASEMPVADPAGLARQVRLAYDGALAGFVRSDRRVSRTAAGDSPADGSLADDPPDDDSLAADSLDRDVLRSARRLAAAAVRAAPAERTLAPATGRPPGRRR